VFDPAENFDYISCAHKTGVDPEPLRDDIVALTSDQFFDRLPDEKKFDIIFIDGLHHEEQVTRDIINALEHLSENGTIVCHDMLPTNKIMQQVPRKSAKWMGDCWKSWAFFRMTRVDLDMQVIDSDCGMGIIKKGMQSTFIPTNPNTKIDYSFYKQNKKELVNTVSVADFRKREV
jgi:hypothetical protein